MSDLPALSQNLLEQAQSELEFEEGEFAMFVIDVPDLPQQYAPVIVAQTSQGRHATEIPRMTGVCQVVQNRTGTEIGGQNVLSPAASAVNYFWDFEKQDMKEREAAAKVTLVQLPKHGRLVEDGKGVYVYRPDPGYYGKDKAIAQVEIGGYQVKVVYFLQAVEADFGQDWIDMYCGPKGYQWKISLPTTPVEPSDLRSMGSRSMRSMQGSMGSDSIDDRSMFDGRRGDRKSEQFKINRV